MVNKILANTRYIMLIAVLCAFIASIALLLLAGIETFQIVVNAFSKNLDVKTIKVIAINFIEIIDILLLGAVFYITAMGLYELFIDDNLLTPAWLHITELDDLKQKLIGVVVVILIVIFLGQVVSWDGKREIFFFGAGIAAVIVAITYFLGWRGKKE